MAKDKAIKRFIVRNIVDASAIRDIQDSSILEGEHTSGRLPYPAQVLRPGCLHMSYMVAGDHPMCGLANISSTNRVCKQEDPPHPKLEQCALDSAHLSILDIRCDFNQRTDAA